MRWLALAVCWFGCNVFIDVPKDLSGDVQIDIVNNLDADLCEFAMAPPNGQVGRSWLKKILKPGVDRKFEIKPGQYKISVGCLQDFHGEATVELARTTRLEISLSGTPASRPDAIVVPVFGNVGSFNPHP